ncbi:MAG: hypothetical protein ACJ8ER_12055 [Allosphingosinicella sp.]
MRNIQRLGFGLLAACGATADARAVPPTIPGAFLGTWDISKAACRRPSDARLVISPRELRFHESIGTVRRVAAAGTNSIAVTADYQGEGERWRSEQRLSLSVGGRTLTLKGQGDGHVRVRCGR